MKQKILLVYKDLVDFQVLLQCIKNRYGNVLNKFHMGIPSYLIITEHIEFYCVSLSTDFNFFRVHRYDDIYISHNCRELITDEIRELLFYGLHDLEFNSFYVGGDANE